MLIREKGTFLQIEDYKYALLKDGTITKIWSSTHTPKDLKEINRELYTLGLRTEDDIGTAEEQEVYFKYRFLDRFKYNRKSAWVRNQDILAYSNSIKKLKKYRRLTKI